MKDTTENLMAKFIEATRELREFIKKDDRGLISFRFSFTEHEAFRMIELHAWGKVDDDALSVLLGDSLYEDAAEEAREISVENIERVKDNLKIRIREFLDNYEEMCEKYRRENEDAE